MGDMFPAFILVGKPLLCDCLEDWRIQAAITLRVWIMAQDGLLKKVFDPCRRQIVLCVFSHRFNLSSGGIPREFLSRHQHHWTGGGRKIRCRANDPSESPSRPNQPSQRQRPLSPTEVSFSFVSRESGLRGSGSGYRGTPDNTANSEKCVPIAHLRAVNAAARSHESLVNPSTPCAQDLGNVAVPLAEACV